MRNVSPRSLVAVPLVLVTLLMLLAALPAAACVTEDVSVAGNATQANPASLGPTVQIAYPQDGVQIASSAPMMVWGTASDPESSLTQVQVALACQNGYWNGTAWVQPASQEEWQACLHVAEGTTAWSWTTGLPPAGPGVS